MPSDLVAPSSGADGTAQVAPPPPLESDPSPPRDGHGPVLVVALALAVTAGAVVWMFAAGGGDSATPDTPIADVAVDEQTEAVSGPVGDVIDDGVGSEERTETAVVDDGGDDVGEVGSGDEAPATVTVAPSAPIEPASAAATEGDDVPTDDAVADDAALDTAAPVGQPQSRAAFRDGQVVLFGKVPSREVADEIFDLAASLLGPENVVDEYEIDPAVPAPTTGNLTVEETIEFSSGAAVLPDPVPAILPIGAALMTARPSTEMRIIGHTDGRGSEEANLRLSLARADSVKAYLVAQGIEPSRIETVGFGEAFPVASDDTEEGRRQNRRIEFEVQNILGEG